MQTAVNLCITLCVILFLLLILYLVIRLFRRLRAVILLQEVADNPKLRNPVGKMLSVYYRRLPVFHNMSIPFRTRDGVVMCRIQYLMVNRGGILLIAAALWKIRFRATGACSRGMRCAASPTLWRPIPPMPA